MHFRIPVCITRYVSRAVALPLALLLLAASAGPLVSQEGSAGRWALDLHGGQLNDEPEFDTDDFSVQLERDYLVGARFGYTFPMNLFLESEVAYSPVAMVEPASGADPAPFTKTDLNMLTYGGALGYNIGILPWLEAFPVVGAGAVRLDPGEGESRTNFSFNYGAGLRFFASRSFAFRTDARMRQVPSLLASSDAGVPAAGEDLTALQLSAGFSILFGGESEPADSDGDGVADVLDRCPATPSGVAVNADGCARDGDADGVADYLDACPDTPAGARVDADGCATDRDADGVADYMDECPNTRAGAPVDARGCERDTDGDNVPDSVDQCPNTAPDTKVDEVGCPRNEIQRELEETGRIILNNVEFDFNAASLRPDAKPILNTVGEALVRNNELSVEIQGHTDAIGTAAYNRSLSQRRARAVLDYLLSNFPELSEDQYVTRGYGEERPVSPNETPQGRQENRRVEFQVLSGPDSVREERR